MRLTLLAMGLAWGIAARSEGADGGAGRPGAFVVFASTGDGDEVHPEAVLGQPLGEVEHLALGAARTQAGGHVGDPQRPHADRSRPSRALTGSVMPRRMIRGSSMPRRRATTR